MRRNIYFNEQPENAPASIILTTLAAQFYEGQPSISETLEGIVSKVRDHIQTFYPHKPFKLPNPVNPGENLADVWETKPELYRHFISFIEQLYTYWQELKKSHGIEEEAKLMKGMFGEDPFIKAMEAKSATVNQRRNNGLAILPTGVIVGNKIENSLPVKPNTFYGD
jgi:hypothetical protein